eukprot:CAMPEP_0182920826 /NCGR_PEP_ID=MMETSP0105_2-20130417/3740_1 /TAXON_ID=81532 ORGANISM="Acanthoeca-like sp., Strain 10tr" /NCGR_SAMPLE_ID=MMETSP0105_2 /ASSEMBLY_ACC=CAM_ASM_000205 /LENGTH=182 /DNA_ID=CAMNT_0025058279 /DNA_START=141 /DNA_END=689 /DNA_ORIENTATION=+
MSKTSTTTCTTTDDAGITTVTTTTVTEAAAGGNFEYGGYSDTYDIALPAAKIADAMEFGALTKWKFADSKITSTGTEPGAKRRIELFEPAPMVIDETCVANFPGCGHAYTVDSDEVLSAMAMEPKSYRGSVMIVPVTETSCKMVWVATYRTSDPATTAAALGGFKPMHEAALRAFEVERGQP